LPLIFPLDFGTVLLVWNIFILLQNILITVHKTTYDAHILKVNKIVHMSLHMMYTWLETGTYIQIDTS
jgi:hypothetical protein